MVIVLLILMLLIIIAMAFVVFKLFFQTKEVEKDAEEMIPTTQDNLPFEYIRSGIVKLKSGGYRLVVEIPSINIDLMEAEEKQAKMEQYRSILNSIDFPIQFLQQSRVVDISDYLQQLDIKKKTSDSRFIKNQLEFYSKYLEDLIKYRSILTKKFYLVIPYQEEKEKKDYHAFSKHKKKMQEVEKKNKNDIHEEETRFEKARKQLFARGQMIERAFKRFEVEPHILSDEELLELYYTSYNKDRSVYQPMKDMNPADYTTLRVKRSEGKF